MTGAAKRFERLVAHALSGSGLDAVPMPSGDGDLMGMLGLIGRLMAPGSPAKQALRIVQDDTAATNVARYLRDAGLPYVLGETDFVTYQEWSAHAGTPIGAGAR